ncbi:DUF397 domain-containing protein [Actinomycetes bacterium KLBMP 9797]
MGRPGGWLRSSRCESSTCVEIRIDDDAVAVRDSVTQRRVTVSHEQWRAFCAAVKAGHLGGPSH